MLTKTTDMGSWILGALELVQSRRCWGTYAAWSWYPARERPRIFVRHSGFRRCLRMAKSTMLCRIGRMKVMQVERLHEMVVSMVEVEKEMERGRREVA